MLFFSVAVKFIRSSDEDELLTLTQTVSLASKRFYERSDYPVYIFAETIMDKRLMCVAMLSGDNLRNQSFDDTILAFLGYLNIEPQALETNEITCSAAIRKLRTAAGNGYVTDADAILDELDIRWIGKGSMAEKMISTNVNKEAVLRQAAVFSDTPSLLEEVERVFQQSSAVPYAGHPVHYIIEMDCQDQHLQMTDLLLSVLYANRRIRSKRYVVKKYASVEPINESYLLSMFSSCEGGTCVIDYVSGDRGNEDPGQPEEDAIGMVCSAMSRFKHSVLTVICVSPIQKAVKELIIKRLPSFTFIKIAKEGFDREGALSYLENLADIAKASPDDSLTSWIRTDRDGFTITELQEHFDNWYDVYLKRNAYPQYAKLLRKANPPPAKQTIPISSAYDQLQRMIGLQDAKSIIDKLLNYCKAQRLFRSKGAEMNNLPMHMVFTGNPGTAKTTAARLFAQIMKDNGILSVGNLLEVGRADLVGKYVGWTARLVKEKFKEAKGSVLFIDEAYSLVDDREGMYGDEAINAIVQEMENQRDQVVVIFAGYPGKMEGFLKKNPGMRSRIGFRIHFPDYSTEELFSILASIAEDNHMKLAPGVREKLLTVFETAKAEQDYGNGRFVRNAFEKARLSQASRLLREDIDDVSKDDVMTLCAEDFDMSADAVMAPSQRMIGFGS